MTPVRRALVVALALALGGCFEEVVREDLELRFDPAGDGAEEPGRVEIDLSVRVPSRDDEDLNPALRNRLEGERHQLLEGRDDWSGRFERAGPARHSTTFEREAGVLSRVRQSAVFDLAADPDALHRFFSDTLVSVAYTEEGGRAELSIQPLAAGRETWRQRQRLERAIDPWSETLAAYLRAAGTLYTYLDEHPERATACFSVLLEDALPEEERGRREDLRPEERRLVEAVESAMVDAWEVLTVAAGEAHSLDEISRLAHDPFPARLRVVPGGPVVAFEGFEEDGEGGFRVPTVSLWSALRELEGAWLAPDPLLLLTRAEGDGIGLEGAGGEPPSLAQVAAQERVHPPAPSATEIRGALESRLVPRPYYRVVWDLP